MARVAVTGAHGMLAATLAPTLRAHGHDVRPLGRRPSADTACVDLADAAATGTVLDAIAPDVIVNLAAATNVDACEKTPQLAYRGNVRVVENLARWIRRRGSATLVHISSDQLYDGVGPHREDDVTLTNYYAFSKYAGELAASAVPSIVLRTNFFGRSACASRASLSDWIVGALRRGESITVFDDVRFSPLSMHTLSSIVATVVESGRTGVFNLGSREGLSKADFAFALAGALGLPTATMRRAALDASALAAYRPRDMRLDSTRFEQAFGMRVPTLQDEIEQAAGEYLDDAR